MKIIALVSLVFLACTSSVRAQPAELPNTQIKDLSSGKRVAFNETFENGKITVVSFWATWCVPCKKEIRNIRDKLPVWKEEADFDFVTISCDESRAEGLVRSYAKSQGWDFPYYIDPNSDLKRSLNFQTLPFTIIIDKDGKIVYMHTGYEEGTENAMFDKVREIARN